MNLRLLGCQEWLMELPLQILISYLAPVVPLTPLIDCNLIFIHF